MCDRRDIVAGWIAAATLLAVLGVDGARGAEARTERNRALVPSTNTECAGARDCVSVTGMPVTVQPGRKETTRLGCPALRPHFIGWDAAQHEEIQVELVAFDDGSATIQGINRSAQPRDFVVSIGCSSGASSATQMNRTRILGSTDTQRQRVARTSGQPGSAQYQDPCTLGGGVPNCQAQQQQPFFMWGWHTGRQFFDCQAPYPYVWNYTYTEAGGSGVTSIGYQFEESPQSYDIWFTNWSVYQTGSIVVTLACSKTNSWAGNDCGPVIDDPMCPIVPNSTHYNCSKTFPGVCFSTHQEQCSASSPILDCTLDFVFRPWCQAQCSSSGGR